VASWRGITLSVEVVLCRGIIVSPAPPSLHNFFYSMPFSGESKLFFSRVGQKRNEIIKRHIKKKNPPGKASEAAARAGQIPGDVRRELIRRNKEKRSITFWPLPPWMYGYMNTNGMARSLIAAGRGHREEILSRAAKKVTFVRPLSCNRLPPSPRAREPIGSSPLMRLHQTGCYVHVCRTDERAPSRPEPNRLWKANTEGGAALEKTPPGFDGLLTHCEARVCTSHPAHPIMFVARNAQVPGSRTATGLRIESALAATPLFISRDARLLDLVASATVPDL
ncbi:hypothetical protein L249_3065, partial [Ophiocordyceps polyrhachis-furcata BCC 54312]